MDSASAVHRLQFAFTATYHYLFPQLTMGLALLLLVLTWRAWRSGDEAWARASRFWARLFAIAFVFGVATGIPLELQFGTNWGRFTAGAGEVVAQGLAMEGVFAFFLESTLLGVLLFGDRRLGPRGRVVVTALLWLGTWLSAYFVVTANAFMQHPVGHEVGADGRVRLASLPAYLGNPWAWWQTAHALLGSVVTASVAMAGTGAWYVLSGRHADHGRRFVRLGVAAGLPAALLLAFPTGDVQARLVARHQPEAFAAMEGHFTSHERGAALVILGQPDVERLRLDNPVAVPRMLSFLTHYRFDEPIPGLDAFPRDRWPQNVPLLYYAYHVMVGLGTILIAVLALAAWRLRGDRIFRGRRVLWLLLLSVPFPYVANTAGWVTAELGRQPWVVHGVMRTADAHSDNVSAGNATFTLIGFAGLYTVLSLVFVVLVTRRIALGPDALATAGPAEAAP